MTTITDLMKEFDLTQDDAGKTLMAAGIDKGLTELNDQQTADFRLVRGYFTKGSAKDYKTAKQLFTKDREAVMTEAIVDQGNQGTEAILDILDSQAQSTVDQVTTTLACMQVGAVSQFSGAFMDLLAHKMSLITPEVMAAKILEIKGSQPGNDQPQHLGLREAVTRRLQGSPEQKALPGSSNS